MSEDFFAFVRCVLRRVRCYKVDKDTPIDKGMEENTLPRDNKGRFKDTGKNVKMAKQPFTVRLPEDVDQMLRQFPDRREFLREVISKAVRERVAS